MGIVPAYIYLSGKEKVQIFDRLYGCGTAQFDQILSISQKLTQFTQYWVRCLVLQFITTRCLVPFKLFSCHSFPKTPLFFLLVEQLPQAVVKSIELQGFLCSSVWSWVSVGYVDSINDIYFVNCLQCFVRWFPKAFLFSGDAKAESLAPKTIEC